MLKELACHFEGIRGKSHPAVSFHIFENMAISLAALPRPAKVAGFEGARKDVIEFAVTVTTLGGPEPANVLPVRYPVLKHALPWMNGASRISTNE
jgi:hypothetical protein